MKRRDVCITAGVGLQSQPGATIKSIQKDTKIKGRALYMPIRIAVSHEMHGPELPETIELLGRETTMKHLDAMIAELAK